MPDNHLPNTGRNPSRSDLARLRSYIRRRTLATLARVAASPPAVSPPAESPGGGSGDPYGHLVSLAGSIILAVAFVSETIITTPQVSVRWIAFVVLALCLLVLAIVSLALEQPKVYAGILLGGLVLLCGVMLDTSRRPDLVIRDVTLHPAPQQFAASPSAQTLVVVIENKGHRAAQEVVVELRDTQGQLLRRMIPDLPGHSATSITLDARQSLVRGFVDFCIEVDPDDCVLEWDEASDSKRLLPQTLILPMDFDQALTFLVRMADTGETFGPARPGELIDLPSREAHYIIEAFLPNNSCATCSLVPMATGMSDGAGGILDRRNMHPQYPYAPALDARQHQQKLTWMAIDGAYRTKEIDLTLAFP